MKLFLSLLLAVSFLTISTKSVSAALCAKLGGRCVFSGSCANGAPLSSTNCTFPGFKCCPKQATPGTTCADLGGRCVFSGSCVNGGALPSSNCTAPGFRCCPTEPGNPNQTGRDITCADGTRGIQTALGCISYDAEGGGFVRSLLGVIIGLGGGVALLLILYGVFIVTTSAGIPDKLNQGKEIISSAVAGLVFIILAIFLMNLIGIRILALPGLE